MPLGPLIIVSGPSGSGKSSLLRRLLTDAPWPLRHSVSVTTRPPRPGEREGVHYYFWDRETFERELKAGAFLEWAEVFGKKNYYGTLHREVRPYRERGEGVLLEIDVQGRSQVKACCPEAVSIFIRTPSPEVLEQRLRGRATEREEVIRRRLEEAQRELERATEYDYQVINDDFDRALAELRAIVAGLFDAINESQPG